MLERALVRGLASGPGRVFADLWDLERFSVCAACFPARRARLEAMNLGQRQLEPIRCPQCGELTPDGFPLDGPGAHCLDRWYARVQGNQKEGTKTAGCFAARALSGGESQGHGIARNRGRGY